MVVTGTQGTLTPRGSVTFADFISQEDDLENLRESHSVPTSPLDTLPDYVSRVRRPIVSQNDSDANMLKQAAKAVSFNHKFDGIY